VLNRRALLAATLAGTALAARSDAQPDRITRRSDRMRMRPTLTAADVQRVVTACRHEAERQGFCVAIAVVDESGSPLYLERLDGALPITATVAIGKAQTSAALRIASGAVADLLREMPGLMNAHVGIAVRGALPLSWQGECIGAVGVSGMDPGQDEQLAAAGVAALG
jgi:glc operon protein GlcG